MPRPFSRSVSLLLGSLLGFAVLLIGATPSWAYPFWAQEIYPNPREATGRIVCANCHLAQKPVEIEVPQAILPNDVFAAKVKVPYDKSVQEVWADGSKGDLAIGAVLVFVLMTRRHELIALSREAFEPMIVDGTRLAFMVFVLVSLAVAALAALDVPYQRWSYLRRLRMSKKEVSDEMKDVEGRPEVRQQIRRKQREISRGRMLGKVKDADVIIVNPTEFAIALEYDESRNSVPIVLAKGRGEVARAIKERGEAASIPRVEAPPLARALYYTTEVDAPIPEGLYRAVAAVLAYVFRLSAMTPDLTTPELTVPEVPSEFRFDENGNKSQEADR